MLNNILKRTMCRKFSYISMGKISVNKSKHCQKNKRQVNNRGNVKSVTQSLDYCTKSVMRRISFNKMYRKDTFFFFLRKIKFPIGNFIMTLRFLCTAENQQMKG